MSLESVVFGRVFLPLAYRTAGDRRLRDIPEFLEAERLAADVRERRQVAMLKDLLVRARTNVPYFRELFRSLSFDPRAVTSVRQLRDLPAMTRDVVREQLDRLRDPTVPEAEVVRDATGGSTGTPMEFFHDRLYRSRAVASAYRTRMWGGWLPGSRTAWIWGAPQETRAWTTPRGRAIGWISRNIYLNAFNAGPDEMADWIRRIEDFRPEFIYGYASSIAYFAEFLAGRSARVEGVRGVFSTAEKLHAWQREAIASAFRAPVYDHYGSREVKSIAAQCEAGSMHVLAEMNIVEMEDPTADSSPLLITSLENRAMPFVRYKIGDVGALTNRSCSCGRTLPVLDLAIGRETDIFVTPEGRHVHGEYFTHLLYGVSGIVRFQFYQPVAERVLLRVIPGATFDESTKRVLLAFEKRMHKDISPSMRLEIEIVDNIPPSPTGKFRFTWSDVPVGGRAAPQVRT